MGRHTRYLIGRPAAWLALSLVGVAALAAPVVEVTPELIDVGPVVRGETRSARFVVTNRGDRPLRILDVKTSCSCTVPSYAPQVGPGESSILEALLDTTKLRGDVNRGLVLMTNDPARPRVSLLVKASVQASVELFPQTDLVLDNTTDVDAELLVLVRKDSSEEGDLKLRDVETSARWLRVDFEEIEEKTLVGGRLPPAYAGDVLLRVALEPWADPGRSNEMISFGTGLPREPTITLELSTVRARLANLAGGEVVLAVEPGAVASGSLQGFVRRGLDAGTLRVESADPNLRAWIEPGTGRRFTVHLEAAGEAAEEPEVVLRHGSFRQRLPVRVVRR